MSDNLRQNETKPWVERPRGELLPTSLPIDRELEYHNDGVSRLINLETFTGDYGNLITIGQTLANLKQVLKSLCPGYKQCSAWKKF